MTNTLYIAFRDKPDGMIPVSRNGNLRTFATLEEAKDHRGILGVAIPVSQRRAIEICKEHKLKGVYRNGKEK